MSKLLDVLLFVGIWAGILVAGCWLAAYIRAELRWWASRQRRERMRW